MKLCCVELYLFPTHFPHRVSLASLKNIFCRGKEWIVRCYICIPPSENCLWSFKPSPKSCGESIHQISLQLPSVKTELLLAMASEESLRELCPCPLQLVVAKWDLGATTLRQSNHLPLWTTMCLLGPRWFSWVHPNASGREDTLAGQCLLSVCMCWPATQAVTAVCLSTIRTKQKQARSLIPWWYFAGLCISGQTHLHQQQVLSPLDAMLPPAAVQKLVWLHCNVAFPPHVWPRNTLHSP